MLSEKTSQEGLAIGLSTNLAAYLASTQDLQRILAHGVNPDGSLKPEAIRALLKFRGMDVKAMAELYGTSDQYFHQVLNRHRRDRRVEDLIAEKLGLSADRVWGRKNDMTAA